MNAWYDKEDTYRRLMYDGCVYHTDVANYHFRNYTRPEFFGQEGESRQGYVAKYHFPLTYTPIISLVLSDSDLYSSDIKLADTRQTMLFEELQPCAWRGAQDALYLKNLTMVSFTISAASGYIDLSTAYASHTRITDSPLILINDWGDRQIIDPTSYRLNGSQLRVLIDGPYTVCYQSTELHQQLLSGAGYLLIDGEQVFVKQHQFENSWDEEVKYGGLRRWDTESNTALKTRYQHISLSTRQELMISSALGQTRAVIWNPQDVWSFTGSGGIQIEVFGLKQYTYKNETLLKGDGCFYFTQMPSGFTQVFYNTLPVDSASYTITGNVLIPLTSRLQLANEGQLTAQYRVQNYTLSSSGIYIQSIGPAYHRPGLMYTLISRRVKIVNRPRRIKSWRWNKEYGTVRGQSAFG
jgi:hypothetical protein